MTPMLFDHDPRVSGSLRRWALRCATAVVWLCATSGCADMAMLDGDSGRSDGAAPRDDADPSCEETGTCEPIEPPWDPEDGGEDAGEVLDAAAHDGAASDARALDGASMDVVRDSAADAAREASAPAPLPTCSNVDQRLRGDFGIVIRPGTISFEGLATEDIGCADRIKVYQMFMLPFAYERYPRRLNPSDSFTMHLYRTSRPSTGSCSAYVPSAQAMLIRDLRQCLSVVSGRTDTDFMRIAMFLIHESGHIITARTPSLRTAFSAANLAARDPRCYDRGFLKTYSLRTTNPTSESFAESLALFIGRRKVGTLGTINDFRTECPNTYEWTRVNVFGDRLP